MRLKNWNNHPIEELALRFFWDHPALVFMALSLLFAMDDLGKPFLYGLAFFWALRRFRLPNPGHDETIEGLRAKIKDLEKVIEDQNKTNSQQSQILLSLTPAADFTEKCLEAIEAMERLVLRHEQYAIALTPSLAENIKHIRRDENFPDLFDRMKPPGEKRKRKREQTKDIKFKKKP